MDAKTEVRQDWQDRERAAAWRKWHGKFVVQTRAATDALLGEARLAAGMHVVDLASGAGDPALRAAEIVGPSGRVTATDLSPGMIENVRAHAMERGIINLSAELADMESLPFDDARFDAAICRLGIMFVPDIARALGEIRRVLRAGARAAFIAWGPREDNPIYTTTTGILEQYVEIPRPPPGAPDGHRFAEPGSLAAELHRAGFRNVREQLIVIPWPWPGPVEEAWESQRELRGAPMQRNLDKFPPDRLPAVIAEIHAAMRKYWDGRQVNFTASLVLASGER